MWFGVYLTPKRYHQKRIEQITGCFPGKERALRDWVERPAVILPENEYKRISFVNIFLGCNLKVI